MTSSKKAHPVEVCGTCAHRIYGRDSKRRYVSRCKLSHAIVSKVIHACQYHKCRD